MLDKDAHFALFFHAVSQEARCSPRTGAAFDVVAHHTDGDMHFALHLGLRRGNGVQAWGQRTQQADQRIGIQLSRREAHHIDNWRRRGVMLQLRLVAHQRQQGFAAR
ncbi:Uncharacterised protein [Klebsiella pneumoniae]|nr:Uncharacterised protein [Klebsiella pneumoniae]